VHYFSACIATAQVHMKPCLRDIICSISFRTTPHSSPKSAEGTMGNKSPLANTQHLISIDRATSFYQNRHPAYSVSLQICGTYEANHDAIIDACHRYVFAMLRHAKHPSDSTVQVRPDRRPRHIWHGGNECHIYRTIPKPRRTQLATLN
jgi:hypothetical protein